MYETRKKLATEWREEEHRQLTAALKKKPHFKQKIDELIAEYDKRYNEQYQTYIGQYKEKEVEFAREKQEIERLEKNFDSSTHYITLQKEFTQFLEQYKPNQAQNNKYSEFYLSCQRERAEYARTGKEITGLQQYLTKQIKEFNVAVGTLNQKFKELTARRKEESKQEVIQEVRGERRQQQQALREQRSLLSSKREKIEAEIAPQKQIFTSQRERFNELKKKIGEGAEKEAPDEKRQKQKQNFANQRGLLMSMKQDLNAKYTELKQKHGYTELAKQFKSAQQEFERNQENDIKEIQNRAKKIPAGEKEERLRQQQEFSRQRDLINQTKQKITTKKSQRIIQRISINGQFREFGKLYEESTDQKEQIGQPDEFYKQYTHYYKQKEDIKTKRENFTLRYEEFNDTKVKMPAYELSLDRRSEQTLAACAVILGNTKILDVLVDELEQSPKILNEEGCTLLHFAVATRANNEVKPKEVKLSDGTSVLYRNSEMCEYLMNRYDLLLNACTYSGWCALYMAAAYSNPGFLATHLTESNRNIAPYLLDVCEGNEQCIKVIKDKFGELDSDDDYDFQRDREVKTALEQRNERGTVTREGYIEQEQLSTLDLN